MDLAELIARVEAATGTDRRLDVDIHCAVRGYTNPSNASHSFDPDSWAFGYSYEHNGKRYKNTPGEHTRITASLDAALALKDRALPGHAAAVGDMAFSGLHRRPWACLWTPEGCPKWSAEAATPALALCLALLRALNAASAANGEALRLATGSGPQVSQPFREAIDPLPLTAAPHDDGGGQP